MSNDGTILIGQTPIRADKAAPAGEFVQMMGETFYRIRHVDQMPTFFMSLVSGADHWMFIASNGGMTAGRTNADSALFPYETEDRLMVNADRVGSRTMFLVERNGRCYLWQPWSTQYQGVYPQERNLYKNSHGNKLIFEEINHELNLTVRTIWRTSDQYGFIKTSQLQNDGERCRVTVLDGFQNILPFGVTSAVQSAQSNLLNAYKQSELDVDSGLGIFSMSATLTDRAEPSESLMASVAWQVGLTGVTYLLTNNQLDSFASGAKVLQEKDIRGQAASYFAVAELTVAAGEIETWHFVADVNQDSTDVVHLIQHLGRDEETLVRLLEEDIDRTAAVLVEYVAAADGLQHTAKTVADTHHFANVMFNIMRGGIFTDGYTIDTRDLRDFLHTRNRSVLAEQAAWLAALPAKIELTTLYAQAKATGSADLLRLCYEYLPLTFSRRHGDPSRPWNRFSINSKRPDGSPKFDYEGNWRDIFQNWEPLLLSFPAFTMGVIAKFLNATTADGYNPYRITRAGIEWEVPEPDNPWANIGYWSDHQIIYLQKLLEIAEQVSPGMLREWWDQPLFATANVPYRIRPYSAMLQDWYDTIDFDHELEKEIETAVSRLGTDGRLLRDKTGGVRHSSMKEKLLTLLLAKLTNLVPEGGIWMNTQRPEWNDANNALVGKGISVVTAAYLRRFIAFWQAQLAGIEQQSFTVNTAVAQLFNAVLSVLNDHAAHLATGFDNQARRTVMDRLGTAVTEYRTQLYEAGLPDTEAALTGEQIAELLTVANAYLDQTLQVNRRQDHLYHSYNILQLTPKGAAIGNLYPMLEGQVAILSAGILSPNQVLDLLKGMRQSALYRADQHSYLLYPNRELPGFLQKNTIPEKKLVDSSLVAKLMADGDVRLVRQDETGAYHFNGRFRNANDVARMLDEMAEEPAYQDLIAQEREMLLELFEKTFDHQAFTGRSGTFYAYEGLGSIYWHMVSKLLLAVQECYLQARESGAETAVLDALQTAYLDVREGLGYNKPPDVYGAFPFDPYSHSPWKNGARQPGMTGQVKEEILTRWGELGVFWEEGSVTFSPSLLLSDEYLETETAFTYVDLDGTLQTLSIPPQSIAFTLCQVPVVYTRGAAAQIEVQTRSGSQTIAGNRLDAHLSTKLKNREGEILALRITIT